MKTPNEEDVVRVLADGPKFALEITEALSDLQDVWLPAIYPLLREMESRGLLTSYEQEGPPARGGRPRRYYKLVTTDDAA